MPFVNIWFTSKIIDLLEGGAGMKSLALYIGLAVGINAVLFFINYYLGDMQFVYRSLMYNKELQRISSKLFGMEYQCLENSDFQALVHKHSEAQDRVFSSFVQLTWMMRDFISGALTLLISVVLVVPLVSYAIARNMDQKKYYKFLYFFLLIGIFVPFQVKMMPLVQVMSNFHMLNVSGITVVYIASSVCEGVFLYVAFIQGVPGELEESAYMDGAGPLYTYGKIIFPLLKPMTATVLIMDGLWFWNDFFLPLLALNKTPDNYTLTLFIYNFKSQTTVNYSLIFAGLLLVMLPIMILYVFLQKQIMGGLVNGAVKG